jgi:hypothetical protein
LFVGLVPQPVGKAAKVRFRQHDERSCSAGTVEPIPQLDAGSKDQIPVSSHTFNARLQASKHDEITQQMVV